MRSLMLVVVLVLIGIAGLGYYRGWFAFSTNSKDQTPSATIMVDKNKFHEDEQKAKDDVQGAGQKAKQEVGNLTGKSK
ncbi:MAG: hypothetical protein ABSG53_08365 [Thermoguttaceae bacterium]